MKLLGVIAIFLSTGTVFADELLVTDVVSSFEVFQRLLYTCTLKKIMLLVLDLWISAFLPVLSKLMMP